MKRVFNGIFEFIMRVIGFIWIAWCLRVWIDTWLNILEGRYPTGY